MQAQDTGSTARIQRGIALANAGAVEAAGDVYIVAGTRNYTVSLPDDGDPRCDCLDYAKRGQTCKHGFSVLVYAARERACRRTRKPRTDRRHGGDSLKGIIADLGRIDALAAKLAV